MFLTHHILLLFFFVSMIADEKVLNKYSASFLQNGDVIMADTAEDSTVGKCSEIAGLGNAFFF